MKAAFADLLAFFPDSTRIGGDFSENLSDPHFPKMREDVDVREGRAGAAAVMAFTPASPA